MAATETSCLAFAVVMDPRRSGIQLELISGRGETVCMPKPGSPPYAVTTGLGRGAGWFTWLTTRAPQPGSVARGDRPSVSAVDFSWCLRLCLANRSDRTNVSPQPTFSHRNTFLGASAIKSAQKTIARQLHARFSSCLARCSAREYTLSQASYGHEKHRGCPLRLAR